MTEAEPDLVRLVVQRLSQPTKPEHTASDLIDLIRRHTPKEAAPRRPARRAPRVVLHPASR